MLVPDKEKRMSARLSREIETSREIGFPPVEGRPRPVRDDEARFRGAFTSHYDALLAYALRRTTSRDDAEEAVATAFATAWRRIGDMPDEPATIIWLYRVTWRTLA